MSNPLSNARRLYGEIPFHEVNDIEIVAVTAESAEMRWHPDEALVGNPDVPAIHGGVISAFIDHVGAAVFVGSINRYTPTIDLRVDYLSHVPPGEVTARARRRNAGRTVGVCDIELEAAGELRAVGRGTYKLALE